MAKEYYEILGVDENASQKEIKKAFRRKAKKYHPDSGSEEADEERFKEINEAYQVLSDEEKRKKYDQFGKAGISDEARRRARTDFSGFEDLFESLFGGMGGGMGGGLFGGRRGGGRGRRGRNLKAKLEVSLEEAFEGTTKTLRVMRYKECSQCGGTGSEGGELKTCSKCQGRGRVKRTKRTPFGTQTVITECDECNGRGKVPEEPCSNCGGSGRVKDREEVKVDVPAGVVTGQRLRIGNKGNYGGRNAGTGDLYIFVEVEDHEFFERREENLFYNLELTMPQAALGDKVQVPTMDSEVKIEIPPGTQTGDIFRLQGKGMPKLRGRGKGDLYIKAVVNTPEDLSEKEKELLQELKEIEGETSEAETGFFEAVKDNIKDAL